MSCSFERARENGKGNRCLNNRVPTRNLQLFFKCCARVGDGFAKKAVEALRSMGDKRAEPFTQAVEDRFWSNKLKKLVELTDKLKKPPQLSIAGVIVGISNPDTGSTI